MNKNWIYLLLLSLVLSCQTKNSKDKLKSTSLVETYVTDSYTLYKTSKQDATLILFPGYGGNADRINREFKIVEQANHQNISVILMNYSQNLFLNHSEQITLENILNDIFYANLLDKNNIYMGGFSSGGNVTLLLSNYLKKTKSPLQPKGVFIVDSPIDLSGLIKVSQKNISTNFSETSVQESNWIINTFEPLWGLPEDNLTPYETHSPYTDQTKNCQNLIHLDGIKIRCYSEIDLDWWTVNRNYDWEDLNAFYIEQMVKALNDQMKNPTIEYIKTNNKGYRSNGDRHPHSWSIVDVPNLIKWILE